MFGITERGDACLDLSWVNKLKPGNIIISKNASPEFYEALLKHKDRIIYHCTCTGYGGTIIEPNVPNPDFIVRCVDGLIKDGFPVSQIVLRIDPIIPTYHGLIRVNKVLHIFNDLGIKRVRYSFLDIYPHVAQRFKDKDIGLPWEGFTAPYKMQQNALKLFANYPQYEFESCAEDNPHSLGCISQKDIDILNLNMPIKVGGFQRKGCKCIGNKTELLSNGKRCKHGCLYCYWRDY